MTPAQTAERYGVSTRTIHRWLVNGDIPVDATLKIERTRRYNRMLLDRIFIDGQALVMVVLVWFSLLLLAGWSIGCNHVCHVLHRFGIHPTPPPT